MAVHEKLSLVIAFALTSISTIVVALRFYSRYFLVRKLSAPDWVMLLGLIASWASVVVNYYQIHFMDYSHVTSKETFEPVAVGSLLTFWLYRLHYILALCLIKTSILLFYKYVAASQKTFHRIVQTMLWVVILASFSMFMAAAFQCWPVSDAWSFEVFWNGFYGIYATQCYNPTNFWLFNAGFNIATDAFIWLLPVPFFLNLRTMPAKRRLELISIFSIGMFAIVASCLRLWILVMWLSSWEKQGEHTANLLIWSQVEQNAGIISASIPFLRPLVRKWLAAGGRGREQPPQSPGPVAKLIAPQYTPEGPVVRTPIIPSPSPTLGSSNSPFKVPSSPLVPIQPVKYGISGIIEV